MGLEFFSLHRKVLEGVKEPIDIRQSNIRLTIALFLFILYLLVGAAIYSALETPAEERDAQSLKESIMKFKHEFVKEKGCMSDQVLEDFITKVIDAGKRGISAKHNVTYAPSWGFAQAFFFAGTLVSTVGYGSSSPVTQAGKAFTIFYCTLGIPLFLILLTGFVERLKSPSIWFLGKLNSRLGHLYKPSQIQFLHLFIIFVVFLALLFLVPAAIFMSIEKTWSYLDAFYYCFISLTTIGLGDYTPGDQPNQEYRAVYKIFTTGYLMIGLLCMMLLLATIYDIPQLSFSRFFLMPRDDDGSERARLADKMAPGPKYMRQMDDGDSQVSPASTQSQVATEDSYQHY